ncbi:hypothetical protein FH972_007543 [Carpinus fangiana]|uniref:Uncharacterized protein n=1 Tax=Carpinus fangiana TaxID=176857 RepID=A0A5N6QY52_9ROSI|nr:hypothetical protein FH972_007543 [Carpinus fangiana]
MAVRMKGIEGPRRMGIEMAFLDPGHQTQYGSCRENLLRRDLVVVSWAWQWRCGLVSVGWAWRWHRGLVGGMSGVAGLGGIAGWGGGVWAWRREIRPSSPTAAA